MHSDKEPYSQIVCFPSFMVSGSKGKSVVYFDIPDGGTVAPLFTDKDSAERYCREQDLAGRNLLCFENPAELALHLRALKHVGLTHITIDPSSSRNAQITWDIDTAIASLCRTL